MIGLLAALYALGQVPNSKWRMRVRWPQLRREMQADHGWPVPVSPLHGKVTSTSPEDDDPPGEKHITTKGMLSNPRHEVEAPFCTCNPEHTYVQFNMTHGCYLQAAIPCLGRSRQGGSSLLMHLLLAARYTLRQVQPENGDWIPEARETLLPKPFGSVQRLRAAIQ